MQFPMTVKQSSSLIIGLVSRDTIVLRIERCGASEPMLCLLPPNVQIGQIYNR